MTKPFDPSQLSPLFCALAQAALASSLAAGCADEHEALDRNEERVDASITPAHPTDAATSGPDAQVTTRTDGGSPVTPSQDGWTTIGCIDNIVSAPLSSIRATGPLDYLGIWRKSPFANGVEPGTSRVFYRVLQASGGCSENALACSPAPDSFAEASNCPSCEAFAVSEHALTRTVHKEIESLRALLGPIDTEMEAVLIAAAAGVYVGCPSTPGPLGDQLGLRGAQARKSDDGYRVRSEYHLCGDASYRAELTVSRSGTTSAITSTKLADSMCTIGRRPHGLRSASRRQGRSALGDYFAQAARLEAASVHAFQQLARELTALHAPDALIHACHVALADELRHTRDVAQLADDFGGTYQPPHVEPSALRSAFEIARENAVEGCVRETFGALLATYQATSARDARVREAMRQIADDETMHARLSWQLAAWLEDKLSPAERTGVAQARAGAVAELQEQLDLGLNDDECAAIGMPTQQVARGLLDQLSSALWT